MATCSIQLRDNYLFLFVCSGDVADSLWGGGSRGAEILLEHNRGDKCQYYYDLLCFKIGTVERIRGVSSHIAQYTARTVL